MKYLYRISTLFIILIYFSSCSEVLKALASYSVNYNRVSITSITLNQYSSNKPDGFSWDPLGGKPDIYVRLKEGDRTAINTTTYNNVENGSQTWNLSRPYQMTSLSSFLTINFYDEENGLNVGNDDYMGGVVFSPSRFLKNSNNPYPSQITLVSSSKPSVKATISLRWSE